MMTKKQAKPDTLAVVDKFSLADDVGLLDRRLERMLRCAKAGAPDGIMSIDIRWVHAHVMNMIARHGFDREL